ncbi:hypothetical protein J5N97_009866 [Dioscorea zingiberensis]|uniref:Uncharacterized protein n=1 Tax=Dioscorea zingiberensis TaxID=325984 RepID=A0A9D5CY00_9LILI|nr:hypothetical protein J5N97_009866 [Dioscorea zingiberensis]
MNFENGFDFYGEDVNDGDVEGPQADNLTGACTEQIHSTCLVSCGPRTTGLHSSPPPKSQRPSLLPAADPWTGRTTLIGKAKDECILRNPFQWKKDREVGQ